MVSTKAIEEVGSTDDEQRLRRVHEQAADGQLRVAEPNREVTQPRAYSDLFDPHHLDFWQCIPAESNLFRQARGATEKSAPVSSRNR
jgi:hypothetical protein